MMHFTPGAGGGRLLPRLVALLALLVPAALACERGEPELRLVGTVERTQIELVAPVSETILAVEAERGERVAAGQVLVRLDPTLLQAEVARAEAALASARTRARVTEHELGRVRKLRADRVASEQQLERALLERDEALARLREAEALLAAARKRLRDLALASPVPGILDQLPFDPGERVPAGAVLAVVLADGDPWVRVWLPEPKVARVVPGTPARVWIDGLAGPLRGSVLDVAREPEFTPHFALTERDRVHLVYETRVRLLGAPAELRPGAPAEVEIGTDAEPTP